MKTLKLTKTLIDIPSYLDNSTNEQQIGEYLFSCLKRLPWLKVQKQAVEKNRFNIIAKDRYPTQVIVCDHIDTVQPGQGWISDPCNALVKGQKVYGLGASDSKGNIATLLSTLESIGPTQGLMLLLYIDEEYNFKGVRKFIKQYAGKIRPQIIASADGGNLELGNACRGLIEICYRIRGQAGHSAIPSSGINAISESFQAFQKLKKFIARYKSRELGENTINLAWARGGQSKPNTQELGKEGNVIPDFFELVIEVRTASLGLNARKLTAQFKSYLEKEGLKMESFQVRHDYLAWITPKEKLDNVGKLVKSPVFTRASARGYVDLQMLWEAFGKPICFTFGAGEPGTAHKPNEFVKIDKLNKAERFWTNFLASNCKM